MRQKERRTRRLVVHCVCRKLSRKSLAVALKAVGIGECGLDDDEGGQEADEAEEGHKDVGSGDFHVSGLTKDNIAKKPPEETPEWPVYEVAQLR